MARNESGQETEWSEPWNIEVRNPTSVDDIESQIQDFAVRQNYPNPFNPFTQIDYQIEKPCNVQLVIFDLMGRKVKILLDDFRNAGIHSVIWDGRDELSQRVVSGIYFYKLQAGTFSKSKKMILLK